MCQHFPTCPPADSPAHDAARVVFSDPLQGWSRLCNGVIVFADTGELAPDGHTTAPHRPRALNVPAHEPLPPDLIRQYAPQALSVHPLLSVKL